MIEKTLKWILVLALIAAFVLNPTKFVELGQVVIDVIWSAGRAILQLDPVPGR